MIQAELVKKISILKRKQSVNGKPMLMLNENTQNYRGSS